MTEPGMHFFITAPEVSPETNKVIMPSPEVKTTLPNNETLEEDEAEDFICRVCGKSFSSKADFDLHMEKDHGQINKS